MNQKNILLIVVFTGLVAFGLTKAWDYFRNDAPSVNTSDMAKEHQEDEEHNPTSGVRLTDEELEEFNIQVGTAGPGNLQLHRDLPGEIAIDPDRLAHIVPRFPGLVKEVRKKLGDTVEQGEVLAIVESNESLVPYEVRSLIKGKVIETHLTEGEVISDDDHAFVIADLSEVWANLSVYQKDLPFVRLGQTVEIDPGPQFPKTTGTISYISPTLDEHTRTATARVILPNPTGDLRPGLFITGRVVIEEDNVPVLVPKTALQTIDEQTVVFIRTEDGFKPQSVHVGKTNDANVEILAGLLPGQKYVTKGGFTIKAQLAKGSFGGDEH